jgi:hypothetical protein
MGGCFAVLILVLIVDIWCCLTIFDQMAVYLIAALVAHEADALMITDRNGLAPRGRSYGWSAMKRTTKTEKRRDAYTEHQSIQT